MDLLFKNLPKLPKGNKYVLTTTSSLKINGVESIIHVEPDVITPKKSTKFTYKELSEYTGFTYGTLKRLHHFGEIKGSKINGFTMFDLKTAEYLRERYITNKKTP